MKKILIVEDIELNLDLLIQLLEDDYELITAAKKLSEAKNYSWTSTVDLEGMPFRPGPTEGKWIKDGFMWVSAEMMGNKSEAYLLGTNGVTQVEGEWKTEAELEGSAYSEAGPVIRVPGRGSPRMLVRLDLSAAP